MTCAEVLRYLSPYLDSELDPRTSFDLAEHLARCEPCAARVRGEERLEAALASALRGGVADPALWRRIEGSLPAAPRRRRLRLLPALAGALALSGAALLAWALWPGPRPGELDLAAAVAADAGAEQPEAGFVPSLRPPEGRRGFRYEGGRHCSLRGTPVEILRGSAGGSSLTLYVARSEALARFPEAAARIAAAGSGKAVRCRLPDGRSFAAASGGGRLVFGCGAAPPEVLDDLVLATLAAEGR